MLLTTSCDTLGRSVPASEPPGRLTNLADAASVAATLQSDTATSGERWAATAALARTARYLTSTASDGNSPPAIDRALIIAEASSSVLFQFAALDPPTAADLASLHKPVPNPAADGTSRDDAALDASAALVHATRPGTGPHSIADMLAIATTVSTICRTVGRTDLGPDVRCGGALTRSAVGAWACLRTELAPFNDGSRRPQTNRPPAVAHARTLHEIFASTSAGARPTELSAAVSFTVLDRLDTVVRHLAVAVDAGVTRGQFMAYAADLPYRDSRIDQYLQGRRAGGLVTADMADLKPVRDALDQVRAATAAVAKGLASMTALFTEADLRHDRGAQLDPSGGTVPTRR